MKFDVTKQLWIERFVNRMSILRTSSEPGSFMSLAERLWKTQGHVGPEAAADAEFATVHDSSERFERTERIPVERMQQAEGYVRDDEEWIARCVARVLTLDPLIKADEARNSVADLARLERWRVMRPEAAADQLYTPIKPRRV